MKVDYGNGTSEFGPGVSIELTGEEVAVAIHSWLVAHEVYIWGSRTVTVNDELCETGRVYVDPSGYATANGMRYSGRGPSGEQEE
jgi:hypothetical protein